MCLSHYAMIILASTHFGATEDFNERNPGLGLGCQITERFAIEGGAYENSYSDGSAYALGVYEAPLGPVFVGGFAGLAYYPHAEELMTASMGDLVPVAGVQVRLGPVTARGATTQRRER